MSNLRPLLSLLLTLALASTACATSTGTRPHDMSTKDHEERAAENERIADHYDALAESDPTAPEYITRWGLAESYRNHARAHEKAASVLAGSADPEACLDDADAPYYRDNCPLAAHAVLGLEKTSRGIRVDYQGVDAFHLRAHIRCHLAHAAMVDEAHAEAGACPLLGTSIETSVIEIPTGSRLLIESSDAETTRHIQGIYVAENPPAAPTGQ